MLQKSFCSLFRSYYPDMNHYLNANPIVRTYTNPQDLNCFSYGLNNPVNLCGCNFKHAGKSKHLSTKCHENSNIVYSCLQWAASLKSKLLVEGLRAPIMERAESLLSGQAVMQLQRKRCTSRDRRLFMVLVARQTLFTAISGGESDF